MDEIKLVFILGAGRTGTTLMSLLLDSHSDIMMYPNEITSALMLFLEASKDKKTIKIKDLKGSNFWKQLGLDNFGKEIKRGNLEHVNFTLLNKETLESEIDNDLEQTVNFEQWWKIFIAKFAKCFDKDCGKNKKIYVVKTNETNLGLYKLHTPNSKYIFMIRNPFASLNSFNSFYNKNISRTLGFYKNAKNTHQYISAIHIEKIYEAFTHCIASNRLGNLKVVRLENLQLNTREVMENVAAFLNIKFYDILIQPTIIGNLSTGNRINEKSSNMVFKQEKIKKYVLTKYEVIYIYRYIPYREFYPEIDITSFEPINISVSTGFIEHFLLYKNWLDLKSVNLKNKGIRKILSMLKLIAIGFKLFYEFHNAHNLWMKENLKKESLDKNRSK